MAVRRGSRSRGDSVDSGVLLPAADAGGRRSSSALGRSVVADALAAVDPAAGEAALRESDWRGGYPRHFRALVEAGAVDSQAALAIASAGLASLHHRMRWVASPGSGPIEGAAPGEAPGGAPAGAPGGTVAPETRLVERPAGAGRRLEHVSVHGNGEPERILALPYAGRRLLGDDLRAQLDLWVEAGVMEADAADAVRRVMANPQWLSLPGRTAVLLGAEAQMGPLRPLLRWGADVAAVDVPTPVLWSRLLADVRTSAGRLTVPVADSAAAGDLSGDLAVHAGADLTRDLPEVLEWIGGITGDLVLGAYAYADGARHVRIAAAVDDLTYRLLRRGDRDLALAFLGTPTDVYAVPPQVREGAWAAYERGDVDEGAGLLGRLAPVVRRASRGRLLRRHYAGQRPGDLAINDSVVAQQGPNYLLAKRIQRWRAYEARRRGHLVSYTVAPPTRTRSVTKNRALAAAYAGAHRFGVEVFGPATSSTLMAVLLVHDLYAGGPTPDLPWQTETRHAVHGGLWRTPVEPRSALGLAAVAGLLTRDG